MKGSVEESDNETELLGAEHPDEDYQQMTNQIDEDDFSEGESDNEGSDLRRRDALEHMSRIEKEFAELKDRLYQEKMAGLQREMDQVLAATHAELVEQVNHIEKLKNDRLNMIERWKIYQLETVENSYRVEKEATDNEYQSEKEGISQRLMSSLQEKKKRLEEERSSVDISLELTSDLPRNQPARRLRRRGEQQEPRPSKKLKTTGPSIVHILMEAEIVEDLFMIKKSGHGPGTGRRNVRPVVRN